MRRLARWLLVSGAGVAALAVTAAGITPATAAPSAATRPAAAAVAQTGPVSPVPASGTPQVVNTGGLEQVVRQIVQCGGLIYAVGRFSTISQNGTGYTRNDVFSFSATAPYTMTSWAPDVNGLVDSITLTSDCAHAYIGGRFTEVDGSPATNIADIRTYNNTMVQDWAHSANGEVDTVLLADGHLLAGGFFTSINGSSNDKYYASLSPTTGDNDGYLNLNVSGHYTYKGVDPNSTDIYNQQLSPDGEYVLAEGIFTSVQGMARQQIFMFRLATSHGNVTTWNSAAFSQPCVDKHAFYVTSAAWAPDESAIYIADTGYHALSWDGTFPLTGLCDAAAAFPANHALVSPEWINYTGCDSFYSVASDGSAVYAAGHPRWSENANGCNAAGPGAIPDRGLQGLSPANGDTMLNSSGTKGRYSMARANADDMLVTSAGLWIASTDRYGSEGCGGIGGHTGICFLRYR